MHFQHRCIRAKAGVAKRPAGKLGEQVARDERRANCGNSKGLEKRATGVEAIHFVRERSFERLDKNIAKHDRVVVAAEPEVPAGDVLAGVRLVVHEFRDLAEVGVEDHCAVEFDLDRVPGDRDLLGVPLAGGAQTSALGGNHSVGRPM